MKKVLKWLVFGIFISSSISFAGQTDIGTDLPKGPKAPKPGICRCGTP
jgi:hypothetical protein